MRGLVPCIEWIMHRSSNVWRRWGTIADRDTAFAVLLELPGRFQQVARCGECGTRGLSKGNGLPSSRVEERLGVEGVDLRRATFEKNEDDPLGPGGEMRLPGGEGIGVAARASSANRRRGPANRTRGGAGKHFAAGEGGLPHD